MSEENSMGQNAKQCEAVLKDNDGSVYRCGLRSGHSGPHDNPGVEWADRPRKGQMMYLAIFTLAIVTIWAVSYWLDRRDLALQPNESSISYIPRGDRVLVKRLPTPEPQAGGMILPTSQQRPLNEGTVIAVGPGARNRVTGRLDPIDLSPGEHVCFLDFAGTVIDIDGEEYLSMTEGEIHGKRHTLLKGTTK